MIKSRLPVSLMLAPGTPAVPLAVDGLAPLLITNSPLGAALVQPTGPGKNLVV